MSTKLLIFGITGDLSRRKLLPALERIAASGGFDDLEIRGVSRREVNVEQLMPNSLHSRTQVMQMDMSAAQDYQKLWDWLKLGDEDQLLIYLSVPPGASSEIIERLGQAGIRDQRVKLLLEKPFGVDLQSAKDMTAHIEKYYDESQVYRIDHYLAKEMAQNIIAFRANNALFAHVWDNTSIEKIEVNAFESLDIEGRAQFYEQTGALRDIVQGHLMQLLAVTLMDVPSDMDWQKVPAARAAALRSIEPANIEHTVRAQYEGYKDEVENPASTVETFVSVPLTSSAAQWQGVELRLTTGKALSDKKTEIKVHFKKFHQAQTNCLVIRIQPHEGIEIALNVKKPGYDYESEQAALSYEYGAGVTIPDAYELVLVDAIRSQKILFTTSEEVLESWRVMQPLVSNWKDARNDLSTYHKGSHVQNILK